MTAQWCSLPVACTAHLWMSQADPQSQVPPVHLLLLRPLYHCSGSWNIMLQSTLSLCNIIKMARRWQSSNNIPLQKLRLQQTKGQIIITYLHTYEATHKLCMYHLSHLVEPTYLLPWKDLCCCWLQLSGQYLLSWPPSGHPDHD